MLLLLVWFQGWFVSLLRVCYKDDWRQETLVMSVKSGWGSPCSSWCCGTDQHLCAFWDHKAHSPKSPLACKADCGSPLHWLGSLGEAFHWCLLPSFAFSEDQRSSLKPEPVFAGDERQQATLCEARSTNTWLPKRGSAVSCLSLNSSLSESLSMQRQPVPSALLLARKDRSNRTALIAFWFMACCPCANHHAL